MDPHEHAAIVARLAHIDTELDGLRCAEISAVKRGQQTTKLSLEWTELMLVLQQKAVVDSRVKLPESSYRNSAVGE